MTREQVQAGTTSVWTDKAERLLIVERVFDAPRDLVWKAWTDPEQMEKWWGPRGWATMNKEMDVRPGGVWHYCMTGPEGVESWGKAIYREVVPPERLVYLDVFSDAEGRTNEARPTMVITMEFTDLGGKTKLTSTGELPTAEDLEAIVAMGVVPGLTETLDRLEEFLAAG
ncbi:MAG: SRPBCC domain-containing protein [Chloroflexi bacterium]|nr:SRPBCC domain-containing protein [Chloroflexota bacterium]